MGTTYNRTSQKQTRQRLRTDMTRADKTLWISMKRRRILGYKFRRQHGIKEYVVDFYCPELKLAIEADGDSHDTPDAKRCDARRQRSIEKEGVRFLRFADDEILGSPGKVIQHIEEEVRRLSGRDNAHFESPPRHHAQNSLPSPRGE